MKTRMLQVLVVVLLIAFAVLMRGRGRLPDTPEAAVYELFDAAEKGDDRAYLRLVTGELRKSLENSRSQLGGEAFRQSLRRSAAGVKGVAVPGDYGELGDSVLLDVEIVFTDRIERQRMLLERKGSGWVIAAIEAAQMVQPPIPYGTPVFEEAETEEAAD